MPNLLVLTVNWALLKFFWTSDICRFAGFLKAYGAMHKTDYYLFFFPMDRAHANFQNKTNSKTAV